MEPIGLYLHVPFCASRCPYCDFFTQWPVGDALTVYAETMKTELRDTRDQQICADSVYFGGGTPSVLPGAVFADLLDSPGLIGSFNDGKINDAHAAVADLTQYFIFTVD